MQPFHQGSAAIEGPGRIHGGAIAAPDWSIFSHPECRRGSPLPKPTGGGPSSILEHKPGGRNRVHKTRTTQPRFAVSYYGVAHPDSQLKPPRRVQTGCATSARGTISDFATLVRKSYSDSLSLVSTLVLLESISDSASETWESSTLLDFPTSKGGIITRRDPDDNHDRRSST